MYVSADADAGGDGSLTAPFSSIRDAQAKVRSLKNNGEFPAEGVEVVLRGGNYELTEKISLTAADSGTETGKVVYKSFEGEKAVLSGTKVIPLSNFTVSTDERIPSTSLGKVYSISLANETNLPFGNYAVKGHSSYYLGLAGIKISGNTMPTVLFDGEAMTNARYPNNGYITVNTVTECGDVVRDWFDNNDKLIPDMVQLPVTPMRFTVNEDAGRITRWSNATEAWLHGYWYWDWSDQTTSVKSIDKQSKTITTDHPSAYGVKAGQKFYIYNLLEELDTPGEWFCDSETKEFFIYPPAGKTTGNVQISRSVGDAVVSVSGAENIIFENIEINGSGKKGFDIRNSQNVIISDCTVKNVAEIGISVTEGKNVKVSGNTVKYTGTTGISVVAGDYNTLEPVGHLVENNDISNYGTIVKTYVGGIYLTGVGLTAKGNTIYNGSHYGIGTGGNDNLIENNEIYNVLQEADDMGAIYAGGSMVRRGNVFKGNIIHDCNTSSDTGSGIYGIYFDDQLCGQLVTDNIIYNIGGTGVFINGGRNNTVTNNIFSNLTNYGVSINAAGRATNWGSENNFENRLGLNSVDYTNAPYTKYANLADILSDDPMNPKYNIIRDNKYYGTKTTTNGAEETEVKGEIFINALKAYGSTMTLEDIYAINTIEAGTVLDTAYRP